MDNNSKCNSDVFFKAQFCNNELKSKLKADLEDSTRVLTLNDIKYEYNSFNLPEINKDVNYLAKKPQEYRFGINKEDNESINNSKLLSNDKLNNNSKIKTELLNSSDQKIYDSSEKFNINNKKFIQLNKLKKRVYDQRKSNE